MAPRTTFVSSAVALIAALAGALLAATSAAAAGATYEVLLCHPENRGLSEMDAREPRGYRINRFCDNPRQDYSLQINSALSAADRGNEGRAFWRAPEETGFIGARLQAKLRGDAGHRSRLYMADSEGRETRRVATGDGSGGPFKLAQWDGARQEMFVASLRCENGPNCRLSDEAKAWVRSLRLTLADFADPSVSVGGSLIAGGWKRGAHQLAFAGDDLGSGIKDVLVRINGSELTRVNGDCGGTITGTELASRLRPCSGDAPFASVGPDTGGLPFHEGTNTVSICSHDFAGNETCEARQVAVDNIAPGLAFTNAQDENDPELIHAVVSDRTSGLASGQISYRAAGTEPWIPLETQLTSGELRARVDSTAVPAGTYQLRAVASDVAGNSVETTRRLDGLEKQLAFPLKAGVELNARLEPGGSQRTTVRYGKRSRAAGVLRDASGQPIADQRIVITENFGDGALIRERISEAETDARGRWRERLPAGPSRRVVVSYEGTRRYLAAQAPGGKLNVETRATLRSSRSKVPEGKRVVFRGKLGRLSARIPNGGKLLELQVKQDAKTYQTVGEGFRSSPSGRYRVPYRFGRFYQYDVRFKFRVKVAREADWPYKAPVRSKARKVTVLNR